MKIKNAFLLLLIAVLFPIISYGQNVEGSEVPCTDISQNLKLGMLDNENSDVTLLQEFLYSTHYYSHHAVGEFGHMTLQAVKEFQKDHFLYAGGFVGPKTRALIKDLSCPNPTDAVENNNIPDFTSSSTPLSTSTTPSMVYTESGSTTIETIKDQNKNLPYKQDLFNLSDWTSVWGKVSTTTENTLLLKASASTTGAEAILEGSSNWTNYTYTVNVTVKDRSDVTLIGRYVDDKNFLTCSFNGQYVALGETLDGVNTTVDSTTVKDIPGTPVPLKNITVSMSLDGNAVGCLAVGNTPAVSYTISDPRLLQGGIGIETWNPEEAYANVELRMVEVK